MSSKSNGGGGGVASIPAASKKMVQSLKEIVNCPEVEIYAMLKECNMDPNEAVNRLLSQDPFHEVKSKREKKKENKDVNDPRSRGTSSSSTRGGRGGGDRYSSRGIPGQFGSSDSGTSRGKPAYKKDNGPTAYTSSSTGMAGNNVNRRQLPPVSDATMGQTLPTYAAESISAALPSSGFQSSWGGMPGQVSMADIVKMGRPHGKASSSINTSQQPVNNQHATVSPGVPGPYDLCPSQNYAYKVSELNQEAGVTGNQQVDPNDDWPLDEEPPAASVSSVVEPSVDTESYVDHYDRSEQQFRSQADEIRFVEDDTGDKPHANFVRSSPASNQNLLDDNSGSASGFDNDLSQNINSYQVHHQEVEDATASVTTNFQNLSLPKEEEEEEDSPSEDDGPAVKIPDHLQVQSADCSHLSFGSFGSGMGAAPFTGSFGSRAGRSNDEEVPVAADAPSVGHPEARNSEYYEEEHLQTTSDGSTAHRMGADPGNFDTPSVSQPDMSQPDMLKHDASEVAQGNQYAFPSSTANYAFENSQQMNASSYAQLQAGSQMQGLPSLSGVMPYSNSLPAALLASNVQPLREAELAYSQFPISQSMQTKYSNPGSSINGATVSMAEAMKSGNFSAPQPTQTLPGGSISGGHALPQQLLHPYSQPSVAMGAYPASMVSYPFLPQNYQYMPSAFQQAFAAGNSNYPQSLAAVLPQYKNSVSVSSLPQSAAVAAGYGAAAFGNSNSIPSNFPLNPPTAPAGTSMSYDDVLSSQYKEANHLLSLQQGPGSRTISGVPGSTYYSFQGQNQQPAGFRQSQQQQPSQHYGQLAGYPNYYHSQAGPTLEQQLQMSRDGSLGGSQGQQQPKQSAQQIWQNSY